MPEWQQPGLWGGCFIGLCIGLAIWWLWRKARGLAVTLVDLERNNLALGEMIRAARREHEQANQMAEALLVKVKELSDRNESLENDLRWLRGRAQEDRDTFTCVLRRWIEVVNEGYGTGPTTE